MFLWLEKISLVDVYFSVVCAKYQIVLKNNFRIFLNFFKGTITFKIEQNYATTCILIKKYGFSLVKRNKFLISIFITTIEESLWSYLLNNKK